MYKEKLQFSFEGIKITTQEIFDPFSEKERLILILFDHSIGLSIPLSSSSGSPSLLKRSHATCLTMHSIISFFFYNFILEPP